MRTIYQAVIDQDLTRSRASVPCAETGATSSSARSCSSRTRKTASWRFVKIGQISKTGRSPLGPIAAVPAVVKLKNGKKVEEQMIVQFRQFGGKSSCVIHGPYGLPREIE